MKIKKQPLNRICRAQLLCEAVSVVCPFCGECQPDKNGSELWTSESFLHKQGKFACVSCDKVILISSEPKALFK